ncbi:DUF924 family protein [Mesorhizobium sp. IMUNJ 23232]|uniref:DUF924 family protein n=1 Tax=Mesorhizobium sp. IMUNJ 23232 TaxID=3376064 RepID=UPI00379A7FF4
MIATAKQVVDFWCEAGPENWFEKNDAFDADFRERFIDTHEAAARGDLDDWSESAVGSLALLILLDQFPRNCFRRTTRMYATDPHALRIARASIAAGHDRAFEGPIRVFFYLPYAHSEDMADQEEAVRLNAMLGEEFAKHARGHRDIIARFGRFPHRNFILGRDTAPEEQAFLDGGGFSG